MNIIRCKYKPLVLLVAVLIIDACIPILRSSRGLNQGQFQISYNAPFAGDIRFGVTDNVEYRYSVIGESFESDIMLHYHSYFDYSVAVGMQWLPDYESDWSPFWPTNAERFSRGFTAILSKELYERANPYIGYSYSRRTEAGEEETGDGFFAVGIEVTVAKRNKYPLNLVLTPELMFGFKEVERNNAGVQLGIGLNVDLKKLLKR